VEVSRCWDSCGCGSLHGADTLASWNPSSDINYGMLQFTFPHWQYTVYARADSRTDSRTDSRKDSRDRFTISSHLLLVYTPIYRRHTVISWRKIYITCLSSSVKLLDLKLTLFGPIVSNTGFSSLGPRAPFTVYTVVLYIQNVNLRLLSELSWFSVETDLYSRAYGKLLRCPALIN
jgi:hypothetical protein